MPEFQQQFSQAAIEDMAWMSNYNTRIYVYVIIYLCPKLKAGLSNLYQQKVPLTFSIQTSRLYLIHMGLWNEAICKYSTLYLNPDKWWWDKGHIFTQNSAVIYSPILIISFYSLPPATIYIRHGQWQSLKINCSPLCLKIKLQMRLCHWNISINSYHTIVYDIIPSYKKSPEPLPSNLGYVTAGVSVNGLSICN